MRWSKLLLLSFICMFLHTGCGDHGINIFSTEAETDLGIKLTEDIYSNPTQFPILDSVEYPEVYQRLDLITEKILASSHVRHRKVFPWKLHVVHDDSVLNAFCTPGGFIFVYTGLIKFLESEDQLAGVMGHEIAHADLRHSTEQLTKSIGVRMVLQLLAGDAGAVTGIADQLLQLNFSRQDETEADLKSVQYLSDTDYDPRGVARFFQKMHSVQQVTFLSTHPDPKNRVKKIMEYWALNGSKTGKTYTSEYKAMVQSLP